ncbi:efflux RND transporter periplasmic adaptor subunit [soil metagenome]
MNGRRIVVSIALLGLAALALLGVTRVRSESGAAPSFHTVVVDRGEVSQRVVAHGTLQPVQMVTVGSQVSGIIEAIAVDFNSRVSRGQVLAQIDPSTFAAEARSAEAELESARAALELARLQWQRVQALRERQLVPPSDVEEARAALRQAETQLTVRRHALERARRELARATIRSPTDGLVIARNVDVGQTVAASLTAPDLFEIATDLAAMHIHAYVSEADIGMVREGQTVRFSVDAYRGREFTGEVAQVRNAPIVESNVVHYETIITVDNREGLLKPGMTTEVSIVTEEAADVVRVRNTALRARLPDALTPPEPEERADGRVYALRNGRLVAIPVRTGLADNLHTQILGGVEPGDTLVVGLRLQTDDEERGRGILRGSGPAQC